MSESLINKVGGFRHSCFTNFAKFLGTFFSQKSSGRLLLNIYSPNNSVFYLLNTAIVWGDIRLGQYKK